MRVEGLARPINRLYLSTFGVVHTDDWPRIAMRASASMLFIAATAATLAIGFRDPRIEYGYEAFVLGLAAAWSMVGGRSVPPVPGIALLAISSWGYLELAAGATVYRYATLAVSLRLTALLATTFVSFRVHNRGLQRQFLLTFMWMSVIVAVTSVLAYFTSPGKILWIFHAPYPDVWGVFLSRNNFAQFLELATPVALWFAFRQPAEMMYMSLGAVMLAAGLASGSRAGSTILVLETIFIFWIQRRLPQARRAFLALTLATFLFAAIAGTGNLSGRVRERDPYQARREIARSALQMISSRPWSGFGLGTFATVYPAYAEFDTGKVVDHAHNDWIEWAAEGGVPFALAWIVLALWAVKPAVRSGWGIGVLGCFLHSLVDYPFARIGITAWVFIFLGFLAADDLREVHYGTH